MSAFDDLNAQVEAYTMLLRSPGWQLLQVEFKKRANSALVDMENAKTSEDLARHSTIYLTTCKLMKTPEMLRDTLAQKLQVLVEKL